jgi:hypothetical protein
MAAAAAPALQAAREHLASAEWRPAVQDLAPYLGEWLGDVPALRLHEATEAWLAQRLLIGARAAGGAAAPPAQLEQDDRLWRRIGLLLGEQRAVRVYGLLVPGYDPLLDRIGFYRIVLPRPTSLVHVWHDSPEIPRVVHLLNWALAQPGASGALGTADYEVTGLRYAPLGLTPRQVLERAGLVAPLTPTSQGVLRLQVDLALREAAERLQLRAVFAFEDIQPGPSPGSTVDRAARQSARTPGRERAAVRRAQRRAAGRALGHAPLTPHPRAARPPAT